MIQSARGHAGGREARAFLAQLLPSCSPGKHNGGELVLRGIEIPHYDHGTLALSGMEVQQQNQLLIKIVEHFLRRIAVAVKAYDSADC